MTEIREPVVAGMRPYAEAAALRVLRAHDRERDPPGSWDLAADQIAARIGCPLRTTVRALDRMTAAGELEESPAMGWESWWRLNDMDTPRGARRFRLAE